MRRLRRPSVVVTLALVLLLSMSAVAQAATVYIYEGRGVGGARLGQDESYARSHIGFSTVKYGKDTSYSYTVWYDFFGTKLTSTPLRYQLEMRSRGTYRGSSHVFHFWVRAGTIASKNVITTKGVKVGTGEWTLKSKYGSALKLRTTDSFRLYKYQPGGTTAPYTQFWVSKSTAKVKYIEITK